MGASGVTAQKKEYAYVNGHRLPVQSDRNGKFVILDGQRFDVSVTVWQSDPTDVSKYFAQYYADQRTKNQLEQKNLEAKLTVVNNNLKEAQEEQNALERQYKKACEGFNRILSSLGVKNFNQITDSEQRAQALNYSKEMSFLGAELHSQTSSVRAIGQSKTSLNNSIYNLCMESFNCALEEGKWNNQTAFINNLLERG